MNLIVGGVGQGKLDYALSTFGYTKNDVFFAQKDNLEELFKKPVIYLFDKVIERIYDNGEDALEFIQNNIDTLMDKTIISNLVGSGIVPIDKRDRELREIVGRCNTYLAGYANRVDRLFCGIGQTIKRI